MVVTITIACARRARWLPISVPDAPHARAANPATRPVGRWVGADDAAAARSGFRLARAAGTAAWALGWALAEELVPGLGLAAALARLARVATDAAMQVGVAADDPPGLQQTDPKRNHDPHTNHDGDPNSGPQRSGQERAA